ncbi:MAG TPA: DUF2905 domain-containing protein [Rhabdochlamydiaceae bacterium]|nr:DUF2905 domain-containing protein [Rhabdochlamydiaceae bacterium]
MGFLPRKSRKEVDMTQIAKWIIFSGLVLIAFGLIFWLAIKLGFPAGKLPGDILIQKEKSSFYFPVATSIILSIVLTLVINLVFWIFKK